jgi:inner membrane protein
MQPEHYLEGFHSLFDRERMIAFDRFGRGADLEAAVQPIDGFRRIARFSKGFYALRADAEQRVLVTDLRMGQEPDYTFRFAIARRASPVVALAQPQPVGSRPDVPRVLAWLGRRIAGDPAPPPR